MINLSSSMNGPFYDLHYDPERGTYSLNPSSTGFNVIDGVYHRAFPLEVYYGNTNLVDNNNDINYIEIIDNNSYQTDSLYHIISTDPFLAYLERDRFLPSPLNAKEEFDDSRIKCVTYDELTDADFEFLSNPTKRLTLLIGNNQWDNVKNEFMEPIIIDDNEDLQILESPPITPSQSRKFQYQQLYQQQSNQLNLHKNSYQNNSNNNNNQNSFHPYKISTIRTATKVGTSYPRGQGRKKSANGPKGYKSKSVQAPLRIAADLISRVNQTSEFVGFCGALKVNPFFSECVGRVSASKDEIGNCFFQCANCGTKRRYLPEKS